MRILSHLPLLIAIMAPLELFGQPSEANRGPTKTLVGDRIEPPSVN
jgi:hypothetical protein